jgi:alpha-tubulin suppressor-like RCC1 family protein
MTARLAKLSQGVLALTLIYACAAGSDNTGPPSGRPTFLSLSADAANTCGLTSDDRAYCWGANSYGQLGNGSSPAGPQSCGGIGCSTKPLPVAGNHNFVNVSLNGAHACGVTTSGAAFCWGYNLHGELGVASPQSSSIPVAVSGGIVFASVSAGAEFTCGLTPAGAAYCWGRNEYGMLGNGTPSDSDIPTPTPVAGGHTFASLHPGGLHACGLTTNGAAYCWGVGGALGDSATALPICSFDLPCSATPIPVAGGHTFTRMSSGSTHTCAVTPSGAAYCWGQNDFGQLGTGTATTASYPVPVSGGLSFVSLSGGGYHTCGVTGTGKAYCWGTNTWGELGDHGNSNSLIPVPVFGQYLFSALSAGFDHTCGIGTGGQVYCWGRNAQGMLGNGRLTDTNWPGEISYPNDGGPAATF